MIVLVVCCVLIWFMCMLVWKNIGLDVFCSIGSRLVDGMLVVVSVCCYCFRCVCIGVEWCRL